MKEKRVGKEVFLGAVAEYGGVSAREVAALLWVTNLALNSAGQVNRSYLRVRFASHLRGEIRDMPGEIDPVPLQYFQELLLLPELESRRGGAMNEDEKWTMAEEVVRHEGELGMDAMQFYYLALSMGQVLDRGTQEMGRLREQLGEVFEYKIRHTKRRKTELPVLEPGQGFLHKRMWVLTRALLGVIEIG